MRNTLEKNHVCETSMEKSSSDDNQSNKAHAVTHRRKAVACQETNTFLPKKKNIWFLSKITKNNVNVLFKIVESIIISKFWTKNIEKNLKLFPVLN